jgi:DNA-binding transcriptional LysR family regulator
MTFDQLETLEMIILTGSFKAAAEKLHKTQPTLSVSIKNLELEFDLLIFNRDLYRPQLTNEGKIFFEWAKQCLQSYRNLQIVGTELGTHKMESNLTVVFDPLARYQALKDVLRECSKHSMSTELLLRSEIFRIGLQMLLEEKADFAIAPMLTEHKEIEAILYDKISLVPVISKNLIKKKAAVTLDLLKSIPQLIVVEGVKRTDEVEKNVPGILPGAPKCFVTDHQMKKHLIKDALGWGRLSEHEIKDELKTGSLVIIDEKLVAPFIFDIHIMRNKKKPMGPIARAIWAHFLQITS